jgi:glycosyltransferase involved in cell wall biosynthesis
MQGTSSDDATTMQEQGCGQAESSDQTEDALLKAKAGRRVSITALICTLNEEESLPHVLPRIPNWTDEVLLVDGHSTDNTVAVAKELRPDIRVLRQPGRGKGAALQYGVEQASGDIIVTVDADGSTDPADMSRFITPLLEGCDFVKGTRFRNGLPANKPWRIAGNLVLTLVFDLLFLRRFTDICSGYNAFWKETARVMKLGQMNSSVQEPLVLANIVKAGLRIAEVPHTDRGRVRGHSKMSNWSRAIRVIVALLKERFTR